MYYVTRISGGTASSIAADRLIARYGRSKVLLRNENPKWEDEDNYRFIDDCLKKRWGGRLYMGTDGRTPLQVAEDRMIIPNDRMAPCSRELKINVFEAWLWRLPKPVTISSGLGPLEPHRIERLLHYHQHQGKWRAPQGFARRIPGVYETFPLCWNEAGFTPVYGGHQDIVRTWGIEPPRMYALGFPHANCGGRCVRQGISEWKRLWKVFPERFNEVRDWEQAQRAKGGSRANAAISRSRVGGVSRPITLVELQTRWKDEQTTMSLFDDDVPEVPDDQSSCFCTDI